MRHIYIVRHGERIDNVNDDWKKDPPRGAWDDPPLSERGHQQALEVGHKLVSENVHIDHIFCSPFTRCVQTADNILRKLEKHHQYKQEKNARTLPKIQLEPGFCEALIICQNPAGFLELEELRSLYPNIDHSYKEFWTRSTLPSESTTACHYPRVEKTIKQIVENYSGNTLIISHAAPISICHGYLTGQFCYVGQCTISKYISHDEEEGNETDLQLVKPTIRSKLKFKCEYVGDSTHLSDQTNLHGMSDFSEKQVNDYRQQIMEYFLT